MLITTYLIITLKAYIILSFLPALFIWIYFTILGSIKNKVFKTITALFMIGILSGGGFFMLQFIAAISQKYALDRIEQMAKGFQMYHSHLDETGDSGSGYQLEVTDFTATGMLKVLPAAVNVTLFRPYVWEVRSPFVFLSALESLFFFGLFLRIFFKAGIRRFIKSFTNADVAMCMIFSIILGFAIGMTAFNFGALVRFKIPLMPFFFTGLILLQRFSQKGAFNYKEQAPAPRPSPPTHEQLLPA